MASRLSGVGVLSEAQAHATKQKLTSVKMRSQNICFMTLDFVIVFRLGCTNAAKQKRIFNCAVRIIGFPDTEYDVP